MSELTGQIRGIKWYKNPIIMGEPYFSLEVGNLVGGTKMPMIITQIAEEINEGRFEYHVECALVDLDPNNPKKPKKQHPNPFIWKTFLYPPHEIQYFAPVGDKDYVYA